MRTNLALLSGSAPAPLSHQTMMPLPESNAAQQIILAMKDRLTDADVIITQKTICPFRIDPMLFPLRLTLSALAIVGLLTPCWSANALARAGDIYPEYAQFYTQQKSAAAAQANRMANEIAQYGIPTEQALDRPGMAKMYKDMGLKDSVAQPDFDPTGQIPIQNLDSIMRSLGAGFFGVSSTFVPSFPSPFALGATPGNHPRATSPAARLATPIAAQGSEKKVIDRPDHADYQRQNQAEKGGSDTYPSEQPQRPCASADPDRPC